MTMTLFSAILLLVIVGIFAIFILKDLTRSRAKGFASLTAIIVTLVICLIAAKPIGKAIAAPLSALLLDDAIFSTLTDTKEAATAFMTTVISIVLFPLLFLILRLILAPIAGAIFKGAMSEEKRQKKPGTALGIILGVISAWLIVSVYFCPFVGLTTSAWRVAEQIDMDMLTELVGKLDMDSLPDDFTEDLTPHPTLGNVIYQALRVSGSQFLFDTVTNVKMSGGETMKLSDEFPALLQTGLTGAAIVLNNNEEEFDIMQIGNEELSALAHLGDCFDASVSLRYAGAELASGFSNAWLQNEPFLNIAYPELGNTEKIVLDGVLKEFKNSTKDTIASDIRRMSGVAATLIKVAQATSKIESSIDSLVDMIADLFKGEDKETTVKTMTTVSKVGTALLADTLNLYKNAEAIYHSFADELRLLSMENLPEDVLNQKVSDLNDKYLLEMTDDECKALAKAMIEHPFRESEKLWASEPRLVPCALTTTADADIETQAAVSRWLASLAMEEGIPTWVETPSKIPSELMTEEKLAEVITEEVFADMSVDQLTEFLTATVEVVQSITSDEQIEPTELLASMGKMMGALTSTPAGKEMASALVSGALQSEEVQKTLGVTAKEANQLADALCDDEGIEHIDETMSALTRLLSMVERMQEKKTLTADADELEDLCYVMENMNETVAKALKSAITQSSLQKSGVGEESARAAQVLLYSMIDNMVIARTEQPDAYLEEASTIYSLTAMMMGNGAFDMEPQELFDRICQSTVLSRTLTQSVDEICENGDDPFALRKFTSFDGLRALLAGEQPAEKAGIAAALSRLIG